MTDRQDGAPPQDEGSLEAGGHQGTGAPSGQTPNEQPDVPGDWPDQPGRPQAGASDVPGRTGEAGGPDRPDEAPAAAQPRDSGQFGETGDDLIEGELVEPTSAAAAEADALLAEALDAASIEEQFAEAEAEASAAAASPASAAQVSALTADLQRVHAEYSNYRKRVERDRELVRQRAVEAALVELLPVLDDIGRARQHNELVGAFRAVGESLESVVAKLGLTPFGEVGEGFDPMRHEALMRQSVAGIDEPTVVSIFQAGYSMNGRVIRPARVAVAGTD